MSEGLGSLEADVAILVGWGVDEVTDLWGDVRAEGFPENLDAIDITNSDVSVALDSLKLVVPCLGDELAVGRTLCGEVGVDNSIVTVVTALVTASLVMTAGLDKS